MNNLAKTTLELKLKRKFAEIDKKVEDRLNKAKKIKPKQDNS